MSDLPIARPPRSASPHPHDAADVGGVCVAAVCALHCIALPALLVAAPVLAGSWIAHERTEWALLAVGVLLGAWAIVPGTARHHRRWRPALLFAAGVGAMLLARLGMSEASLAGAATTVAGAVLLGAAHLHNRGLTRAWAARAAAAAVPASRG